MVLVDYSDSESDSESPAKPALPAATETKPAFQKAAAGKIKVELPSIKPEPGHANDGGTDGPPAKRARTGGAFSGFNSLLPAPKRPAQNAPKAGVGLKTSSEAAFSRNPPPRPVEISEHDQEAAVITDANGDDKKASPVAEPKLMGKPTRFLPLSVSNNNKKKKPLAKPMASSDVVKSTQNGHSDASGVVNKTGIQVKAQEVETVPKPKRSLFSMQQEDDTLLPSQSSSGAYEPMLVARPPSHLPEQEEPSETAQYLSKNAVSNTLEATAADLNLTPSQRRQLFGRHSGKEANVMHFNLENEYAANEQARQAGETVEHRAIKAIAPGKHSLQQLVNNARSQQDAMEDKWAEGRRNRGEGGAKYGWSG